MEKAVPPNPPQHCTHSLTSEDMPIPKSDSPFELSLSQSLQMERLKRDVELTSPEELRKIVVMLSQQLLIKSNLCNALMRGKF
jgi:hypothetical protein